jgi:hypothetical protein
MCGNSHHALYTTGNHESDGNTFRIPAPRSPPLDIPCCRRHCWLPRQPRGAATIWRRRSVASYHRWRRQSGHYAELSPSLWLAAEAQSLFRPHGPTRRAAARRQDYRETEPELHDEAGHPAWIRDMAWKRSAAYPRRAPVAHRHRLDAMPCSGPHATK